MLADRVHQLEGAERRLLELEERVDFAERLLTGRPRGALPGQDAGTPPESAARR